MYLSSLRQSVIIRKSSDQATDRNATVKPTWAIYGSSLKSSSTFQSDFEFLLFLLLKLNIACMSNIFEITFSSQFGWKQFPH